MKSFLSGTRIKGSGNRDQELGIEVRGSGLWRTAMRAAQAAVLMVVVCFSLGATDPTARFNDLGHRLMCSCGCAQLLGECNHVGCRESDRERAELKAQIAAGKGDQEILDWFASKYGATMLAAPPARGFDLLAWIAPFAVFAAATLGTFALVRRWKTTRPVTAEIAAPAANAQAGGADALREKIRRETGEGDF